MSENGKDQRLPLAGVRVLDLSRLMAGNMLTVQLADFGAVAFGCAWCPPVLAGAQLVPPRVLCATNALTRAFPGAILRSPRRDET